MAWLAAETAWKAMQASRHSRVLQLISGRGRGITAVLMRNCCPTPLSKQIGELLARTSLIVVILSGTDFFFFGGLPIVVKIESAFMGISGDSTVRFP